MTTFTSPGYLDDEKARLRALYALGMLDSEPEMRLQTLVERAARTFRAPLAALAFVDRDRVWIKASVGLPVKEMAREGSFCTHLVYMKGVLVVNDAAADPRFAGSPLVAGAPHVRFYAGAALRTASCHAVGSLCIFDTVPRTFSDDDRRHLDGMAAYAANELMVRDFVHTGAPSRNGSLGPSVRYSFGHL